MLDCKAKTDITKQLESTKAEIGKSGKSELESELEPEIEEKKPPDMLDYNNKFAKIECEGYIDNKIKAKSGQDLQEQEQLSIDINNFKQTLQDFSCEEFGVFKIKVLMFVETKIEAEFNISANESDAIRQRI